MALEHGFSREESLARTLSLAELLNWTAQLPQHRDPIPAQNILKAFSFILSEEKPAE